MSLDPFEARLQFLKLLRTLNASQQSIQRVVSFAVKYGSRCSDDLWECIVDETSRGSLNSRINVLYFLDTLCDTCTQLGPPDAPYIPLVERSLSQIVQNVVPDTRQGVLNLLSTRQILHSWATRRVLDPTIIDNVLLNLEQRRPPSPSRRAPAETMARADILRRMEEDRERQKRLRERIWILPIPPLARPAAMSSGSGGTLNPSPASPFTPASPSTRGAAPSSSQAQAQGSTPAQAASAAAAAALMPPPPPPPVPMPVPLDVEFDQMWESETALDEEDLERMREGARAAGIGVELAEVAV